MLFPISINVDSLTGYSLWRHEDGVDEVVGQKINPILSYFVTSDISVAAAEQSKNKSLRIAMIEPDFVQSGEMYVVVTGKSYADDVDDPSDPYAFDPTTLKIDMKEQRREMRLRFGSNTQNGDYFMGRVILSLDTGDVRGTGNP